MGNIIVPCVHTRQEALKCFIAGQFILIGRDEADVIVDVIGQLVFRFNTNHVAVLGLYCRVRQVDQLLGLAGACIIHDDSYHDSSLLFPLFPGCSGVCSILSLTLP